jgi:hypothetical protein
MKAERIPGSSQGKGKRLNPLPELTEDSICFMVALVVSNLRVIFALQGFAPSVSPGYIKV